MTFPVIDTSSARLPADLADKPFDDPEIIRRFNKLLDYVATQTPDMTLVTLSIGNEVDGYLSGEQWTQYETFFRATSDHARELWPGVPVGVKAMFDGLTGGAKEQLSSGRPWFYG